MKKYLPALILLTTLAAASVKPVSAASVLYGSDAFFQQLVTIDTSTGAGTVVGPLGFGAVSALAYDSANGTLYGSDRNASGQLITIDTNTGAGTLVGPLGSNRISGMAYDSSTDTLYGVDAGTAQLINIDRATGAVTAIGSLGFDVVLGLTYDSSTDTLFGISNRVDMFIRIDRATGAGTLIGLNVDPINPTSLAYDSSTDTLFSFNDGPRRLLTIDRNTGSVSNIGPLDLGSSSIQGMAFVTTVPIPAAGYFFSAAVLVCFGWVRKQPRLT